MLRGLLGLVAASGLGFFLGFQYLWRAVRVSGLGFWCLGLSQGLFQALDGCGFQVW